MLVTTEYLLVSLRETWRSEVNLGVVQSQSRVLHSVMKTVGLTFNLTRSLAERCTNLASVSEIDQDLT